MNSSLPSPSAPTSPTGAALPATPASTRLPDLRVLIEFELSRMKAPLSEIETWAEGTIVKLDPPPYQEGTEVTVRANGTIIGLGNLVKIDDRFAVRLTRLFTDR